MSTNIRDVFENSIRIHRKVNLKKIHTFKLNNLNHS